MIKNFISNMTELSDKDYLLGLVGGGERVRTINFVFLWVKLYIFRQRLFHDSSLLFILNKEYTEVFFY